MHINLFFHNKTIYLIIVQSKGNAILALLCSSEQGARILAFTGLFLLGEPKLRRRFFSEARRAYIPTIHSLVLLFLSQTHIAVTWKTVFDSSPLLAS